MKSYFNGKMKFLLKMYILFVVVLLAGSAFAIGVSPPRVVVEDILKGTSVEQSVRVIDLNEGDKVSITLSGEGADWITLPGGNEFIANSDFKDVSFLFDIPQKAPNGEYNVVAQIVISPSSKALEGVNAASVISGLMVDMNFRVTGDEIRKYSVRQIDIADIETGSPLLVVASIKNEGNVIARPSRVEVDVKDKESREIIASESAEFLDSIDPFLVGESRALLNFNLPEDLYFADIRVYDGDLEIAREQDIPFDVLARGTLDSDGELLELSVQGNVKELAKITALFSNTGKSPLNAVFNAEIYKDGDLIDVIQKESSYLVEGDSEEFIVHYSPESRGEHVVKAYVTFAGKTSNTREVSFFADIGGGFSNTTLLFASLIFVALIVFTYRKISKVRNKKREDAIWSQ